jgi:hypothetical protein
MIEPFTFTLSGEENTDDDDFLYYEISYEDISIPFHIIVIDTTKECYPEYNLNFVEFIWKYLAVVKFKTYAIVAVHFTTPKMLYLRHHRANSEGCITNSLCDLCFDEFQEILLPVIGNCSFGHPCKCNFCLLQPPSLRSLNIADSFPSYMQCQTILIT